MRRRRSDASPARTAARVAAALLVLGVLSRPLRGQAGVAREGALFLLVPVGARAVGQGQAVVAANPGGEAVWWNPAALAWAPRRDLTVSYSSTFVATGSALTVVLPAGRAGVLTGAAYLLDYGEQQATDEFGVTGTLYPRSVVLAAAYAATFGTRTAAGLTYKLVQQRFDCSGSCGASATGTASTSAFDFGLQLLGGPDRRLAVGAAVRHVGFRLQVLDSEQADPLPTRVHLGAQYRPARFEKVVPSAELRLNAELVDRLAPSRPSVRLGGECTFEQTYIVRGGFVTGGGDASGAAVGIGVRRGGLAVDFARAFGGFSADAGQPPTYISLRFTF